MITLVIPSRTDAYLRRLLPSIEKSQPGFTTPETVIVADNGISAGCKEDYPKVNFVRVPADPFNFAQAVNLSIEQAPMENDIVIVNDDTEVLSPNFADRIMVKLQVNRDLYSASAKFGILSPKIDGGAGNTDQSGPLQESVITLTRKPVCFIFAIIPRDVFEVVGPLDEGFTGYGWEDTDYNRRAVEIGYKLGLIGDVVVRHGFLDGSMGMSGTFRKIYGERKHTALYERSKAIFEGKWGTGPQLGAYEAEPVGAALAQQADQTLVQTKAEPEIVMSGPLFEAKIDTDMVIPVGKDGYPLPQTRLAEEANRIVVSSSSESEPVQATSKSGKGDYLRGYVTHQQFLDALPPPRMVYNFGKDTDIEMDNAVLWSLAALLQPKVIVEIGTRQAVSTRALAHAAKYNGNQAKMITIDPDPRCKDYLNGVDCEFVQATGEQYFASFTPEARAGSAVDVLFIDTDPHTYEQTLMWLNTWVLEMMAPGGVVAFHDIIQNRPEIQVKEAVRDWIKEHPDYRWIELPYVQRNYRWPQGGMGLLWVPQES